MSRTGHTWRWLPGVVLLLAVITLLHQTATEMVSIWMRHQTYQHAVLVPPISLWLVWRKRAELAGLSPQPMPWVLGLVTAASFLWLMGELALVGAASQFALVALLVLIVPALYGGAVTRVLLFPLMFLFFAVPFGEFTVPTMMHWTADFTVAALRMVGVPVYQEGLYFVIPSGNWSVIEACSGVRYLIASFMVGTLFAHLNYRSTRRRLVFMAASIAVPLIANWLRAFMIVMIGHYSNNQLAVGVDHVLYGWVFFGLVIGLMFMVGARWREDLVDAPSARHPTTDVLAVRGTLRSATLVGIVYLGILFAASGWRSQASTTGPAPIMLAQASAPVGWRHVDLDLPWDPAFIGATAERGAAMLRGTVDSEPVWEWVGYFGTQGPEQKLVSIANRVVSETDSNWRVVRESSIQTSSSQMPVVRDTLLRSGSVLNAGVDAADLVIWRIYWIDGHWVSDDRLAKIRQAFSALRLRGEDGAVVLFATRNDAEAASRLKQYLNDRAPALSSELESVRAGRH